MRLLLLLSMIAFGLSACSGPASQQSAHIVGVSTADALTAARSISAYRAAHGLTPVTVNSNLNQAAIVQAKAVANAGHLSHGNFAARMDQFGVRGTAAENLSAGSEDVERVIARWKASPGHNANLLMPEAREIGFARVTTTSGYRTYWTLVLSSAQ